MQDQYIGVQKVGVKREKVQHIIRIEVMERDRHTRLFINDQRFNTVYPSPTAAYSDAARRLNLNGTDVRLDIDVACNVMNVTEVEQTFRNCGVNVQKATET